MTYLYTISAVLLFMAFILIKKSDNKQNLVTWVCISIMLMFCYNALISIICFFINCKWTVQVLSCINIIICTLMYMYIYNKKKYQKYYIKKRDLLFCFIALIIVLITSYIRFDFPFNINYYITDSAVHYKAALDSYSNNNSVLNFNKYNIDLYGFSNSFMIGHYINCSLFFLMFSEIFTEDSFYILFIIFGMIILYLSFVFMYILLSKLRNTRVSFILSTIISIIYGCAYPMNSYISGFEYLSVCLNLILVLLIIFYMHYKKDIDVILFTIMAFLVNFGIFFSYYLFIPIVYLSFTINLIIEIKRKEIDKLQFIYIAMYAIILPAICGIAYFVIYTKIKNNYIPAQSINVNGGIYRNKISNFILLLPFLIVYILKKDKKNYIIYSFFITSIVFAIIFFILNYIGFISEYYNMKLHYVLWISFLIITYEILNVIYCKDNKFFYTLAILISMIIIVNHIVFSKYQKGMFDIFYKNFEISTKNIPLYNGEIKLLNDISNLNINPIDIDLFTFNYNSVRLKWIAILLDNVFIQFCYIDDIDDWINNSEEKYLIVLWKNFNNEFVDDLDESKYNIIIQTDDGVVLERI